MKWQYQRDCACAKEAEVISFLQNTSRGYCTRETLRSNCGQNAIQRLMYRRKIFRVEINLSTTDGAYARFSQLRVFKKDFLKKTFLCLNRSGVVRLMMDACVYTSSSGDRRTLSVFLRDHLTEAERCAVLFQLGKRHWQPSNVKKRNIQVDGIYFPQAKAKPSRKLTQT